MSIHTVYTDLSDRIYEKKLIDFLTRRYGKVMHLVSVHPGEKTEETPLKRGIYLYDQDLSLEEETEKRLVYGRLVKISKEEGIDPYQSADIIAHKILGHVILLDDEDESGRVMEEGKILAVYSASGGAGVSSLALAMATVLSKKGPTLLLPLCGPSSLGLFTRLEGAKTFSDLLYDYLVEGEEMLAVKLKEARMEQKTGIVCLAASDRPEDYSCLIRNDLEAVMKAVKNAFRYAVLDLSPSMALYARDLVNACDARLEILDPSEEGEAKRAFFKEILLPSTREAARLRKPKDNKRSLFGGENKTGQIADIPEIELEKRPDGTLQLKEDSPYMDFVRRLAEELFGNGEE